MKWKKRKINETTTTTTWSVDYRSSHPRCGTKWKIIDNCHRLIDVYIHVCQYLKSVNFQKWCFHIHVFNVPRVHASTSTISTVHPIHGHHYAFFIAVFGILHFENLWPFLYLNKNADLLRYSRRRYGCGRYFYFSFFSVLSVFSFVIYSRMCFKSNQ